MRPRLRLRLLAVVVDALLVPGVLSLLLVLVLLAGPLLTKDWCVSHAERLEVLGLDGEWLQVRTKDGLVGWVKRTNVVYRGERGGGGGRGGRGGGRGGTAEAVA